MAYSKPTLTRHVFTTSRLLEFTSRKELELQTGHPPEQWPRVVLKELGDNSLDACEEAGISPKLTLTIDSKRGTIAVADNGPGIAPETVTSILDFTTRTSSREAYVSPTRGAQGNALKTVLAMPFALGDGQDAVTVIEARDVRHTIRLSVDAVQQKPVVSHEPEKVTRKPGTAVTLHWSLSTSSQLRQEQPQILQFAFSFALLNPHATITVDFDGEKQTWKALDASWTQKTWVGSP